MKTCHMNKLLQGIFLSIFVFSGIIFCARLAHADETLTSVTIIPRDDGIDDDNPSQPLRTGSGVPSKAPDKIAPQIIDVTVIPLVDQSAVHIRWDTNELTRSFFEYGTTENFEFGVTQEKTFRLLHELTVRNIVEGKTYFYRITVFDKAGNMGRAEQFFVLRGEDQALQIPESMVENILTSPVNDRPPTDKVMIIVDDDFAPSVEFGPLAEVSEEVSSSKKIEKLDKTPAPEVKPVDRVQKVDTKVSRMSEIMHALESRFSYLALIAPFFLNIFQVIFAPFGFFFSLFG